MRPPSTRAQVLIVWTVICGAIAAGLALVAWAPPPECFECGLPQRLAEITMQMALIVWAIVAVTLWVWFAPRD